jgi:hypothetical protein
VVAGGELPVDVAGGFGRHIAGTVLRKGEC